MAQGTGVMTLVAFLGGLEHAVVADLTTAFFATVMAPAAVAMARSAGEL